MSLNFLNIKFQSPEDFLKSLESSLKTMKKKKGMDRSTLWFDSEKTFNHLFTINKLHILKAVSQLKPESIYGLASYLGREPHHVLKDCRLLESLSFLKLEEVNRGGRAALKPTLAFDYDVIKIYSKSLVQKFTVSEFAERFLIEEISEAYK